MDPVLGILVAGSASLLASLAKGAVDRLWEWYSSRRPRNEITIATSSGERVTIGVSTELTDEKIREIVDALEPKRKAPTAAGQ